MFKSRIISRIPCGPNQERGVWRVFTSTNFQNPQSHAGCIIKAGILILKLGFYTVLTKIPPYTSLEVNSKEL